LDIFVLPSLEEGMPMTILEAFAAGRPVVATDVGAISKVVIPDQTGMLVKPTDASGIAKALLQLIQSSELRARCGQEGQTLVRSKYSSRAMSQEYMRLYERLLNQKVQAPQPLAVPQLKD